MMTWGNAVIDKKDKDKPMTGHLNLAGDVKKTELKATWIADCDDLVQLELVTLFNGQQQLITKTKLEPDDEFDKAVNRESSWNIQNALGDQNLKVLPSLLISKTPDLLISSQSNLSLMTATSFTPLC